MDSILNLTVHQGAGTGEVVLRNWVLPSTFHESEFAPAALIDDKDREDEYTG